MDFMKLYNLCTMDVVDHVRPSEGWGDPYVRPQDASLGDDIKRLKWLYDQLSTTDLCMQSHTKELLTSILKMVTEIINRFSTSENIDFTKCFQRIMSEEDIEQMEKDIKHVMIGETEMMDILRRYRDDSCCSGNTLFTAVKMPRSDRHQNRDALASKCLPPREAPTIPQTSTRPTTTMEKRDRSLGNMGVDKCLSESLTEENKRNTVQRSWSSSSSNTREREFVCSQVYFDFVPPQLNHFEYTMKELACIEKSINRGMGPQSFTPTVSQYLSFTFIHGNHMNLMQASLNLFNAVPEKTENGENKSGIIVLFLDRDITFVTLKEMTECTLKHEAKKGKLFAVVQSEELLKDRAQLRNILKPYCRKQFRTELKVVDVNAGMRKLYNEFDEVAKEVGAIVKSLLSEAKNSCISNDKLISIEQRFSKLQKADKSDDRSRTSQGKRQILLSLKDKGLRGYTFENNTLFLYFQRHITEDVIPQKIRTEFPNLKIIHLDHPLFTCHHNKINAGDKLHPVRNAAMNYGTIGMFCDVYDRVKESRERCCISSAHVISSDQTAYVINGHTELGLCVWPPRPRDNCVNVQDVSVVRIRRNCDFQIDTKISVALFDKDISVLNKRKVFKFGASTKRTTGYVSNTNFVLVMGSEIKVFLIEPEDDESRFSVPGDSGAVVLTKFGEDIEAFSLIFGGVNDIPGLPGNNAIAVDLTKAINNFEDSQNKIIELESLRL